MMLTNTAEIWWWLNDHPAFEDKHGINRFEAIWSLHITKVNPETEEIDDDSSKNTELAYWMEGGRWVYPEDGTVEGCSSHDPRLDVGASKFETALLFFYLKVMEFYGGDYEQNPEWREEQAKRREKTEKFFKALLERNEEDGPFVWPVEEKE